MTEKRKDSKKRVLREGEDQRPNGTYQYRWRSKDGKRHSVYAKTLEELREKEEQIVIEKADGIKNENKYTTIDDIYYMWKDLKRGLKDNTFQNYCYMYEQFVKDGFGNYKLCDLKKSDVRRFYNSLMDNRGLKIASIDSVHTVLHQVLDIAAEDGYIRTNVSDNALKEIKLVGKKSNKRHALTVDEQNAFTGFITSHSIYEHWVPIFMVMLNTGMRVGEITGLRWEDVDFENGVISINHTLVYYDHGSNKGCHFSINTPKTEAGKRYIPMSPLVIEMLKKEKEHQEIANIHSNVRIDGYTNFIFVNRFGNLHNQCTLNKALKRIVRDQNLNALDKNKKVILPAFSCHQLRHTFATRLCEAGINIKAIQEILGHSDISTTMDIYAEATNEFKKKEMDKFYSQSYSQLTPICNNL